MDRKLAIALSLSFVLHVVIAAVLLMGNFDSKPKVLPKAVPMQTIQATIVDKSKVEAQLNKIKKKKSDDAKRVKELEQQAASAKRKRAKEEKRIKAVERQRKKKVREKKAAESAAKKARTKANVAEKLRKKKQKEDDQKTAKKAAADAKAKRLKEEKAAKKADDLRKKKAAERKRKKQEAKERAEQQKMLEQQMAEEMASRQSARHQQVMSEVEINKTLIGESINRSVLKDKSTMLGKSCVLTISIAPSGFVTNVVIGKGDAVVCDAAKVGIYQAGTLPVSKDPEVYRELKKFTLKYIPDFNY